MKTAILFRQDDSTQEEFDTLQRLFAQQTFLSRCQIPEHCTVIARYCALPFYEELVRDCQVRHSSLINTYADHRVIADFWPWYQALPTGVTPKSWDSSTTPYHLLPKNTPIVVKGVTNSRKHQWDRMMFAPTREHLPTILDRLLDDPLIANQGLVYREYTPLVTYEVGINGLPITNEWRVFILNGQIVDGGYYWSNAANPKIGEPLPVGARDLVETQVIPNIPVPFYVVDVAEKVSGGWVVIELNDGQMSGLSTIPPERFYRNLLRK